MGIDNIDQTGKIASFGIYLRFILYTLIIVSIVAALPIISGENAYTGSTEGTVIEWVQYALITFTALLMFVAGMRLPESRGLLFFLAALAGVASIRELDMYWDIYNPYWGWQLPALCIGALGIYAFWIHRIAFMQQLRSFVSHRSFALFWAGLIVVVPFAQLVGHGEYLELVLGEDYRRSHKRLIEETGELLGYFLILFGSIELIAELRNPARKK